MGIDDPFMDTAANAVNGAMGHAPMDPAKKKLLMGALGLVAIFISVTLILSVNFGFSSDSHVGFIILGFVLLGFLLSTCTMLWWMRNNDLDDHTKYLAMFQAVLILGLCVGFFLVIYIKDPDCWSKPKCLDKVYSCMTNQPGMGMRCGNLTEYTTAPTKCVLDPK